MGMLDLPMPLLSKVQHVTSGRPAPSRRPAKCATTGCARQRAPQPQLTKARLQPDFAERCACCFRAPPAGARQGVPS